MTTERFDAILDRLDGVLAESDDPAVRQDVREIQQLVIGVREDCGADPAERPGGRTGDDAAVESVDGVPRGGGERDPADED